MKFTSDYKDFRIEMEEKPDADGNTVFYKDGEGTHGFKTVEECRQHINASHYAPTEMRPAIHADYGGFGDGYTFKKVKVGKVHRDFGGEKYYWITGQDGRRGTASSKNLFVDDEKTRTAIADYKVALAQQKEAEKNAERAFKAIEKLKIK